MSKSKYTGKVILVGAGPGDPELLTIKAMKCIKAADVILYDALIEKLLSPLFPEDAIVVYTGKRRGDNVNQTERQNNIHTLFEKYVKEGKTVVRLKAGDPLIFARGAEEIQFMRKNGIDFEIVPGITAGLAGASTAGISLTERDKSMSVLFSSGVINNEDNLHLQQIVDTLKLKSPVIVYMALKRLPFMAEYLMEREIVGSTKVLLVSKVSHPEEKLYATTLQEVLDGYDLNSIAMPAVVYIGENI